MMPDWLGSITVGQIVGWLIAAGAILGGLRWLRPWADGLHAFLEDWQGTPERPGVDAVPGVMEKLRRLDAELREVKTSASAAAFNTGPNHGSSAHDDLVHRLDEQSQIQRRTLAAVVDMAQQTAALERDVRDLQQHQVEFDRAVMSSRKDRGQLRAWVLELFQRLGWEPGGGGRHD